MKCNAKIEKDNDGYELVMGRYGYRELNERGERLLEFAYKNDYVYNQHHIPAESNQKMDIDGTRW